MRFERKIKICYVVNFVNLKYFCQVASCLAKISLEAQNRELRYWRNHLIEN